MMVNRKLRYIASVVILSLTLSPLAEAKRIGGGGSRGMSRSNYSSSYSNPSYQSGRSSYSNSGRSDYRNSNQNNYSNQTQPRGNGAGRVIGAGVAGAAIGALAGHAMANHNQQQTGTPAANDNANNANNVDTDNADAAVNPSANADLQQAQPQHKSGFSWIWLLIIALGGFYLFRRFAGKKNNQANMPYSNYQNSNNHTPLTNSKSARTNIFGQTLAPSGNTMQSSTSGMADGSNPEAFLRFARQRFNHVQSMNNASNLEEIRRYFTPDMFADIRNDIINNQDTAEFSDLNADLADSTQENGQYIASVRFSGLVSEELGSAQQPFSEVWHFVKPVGSQQDWLIAGIQQD
ncbi:MAG: Tim44 domain-containing protein [Snodgrassella sp.]|uniref:Tim44 domain-containing protein n=1 Tax=Snodgrassella sp. TaxID=2815304 RepID=UPI00258A3047|nr:Tim44-like domain-containing protein [Snodgrassella sp.]MCO6508710.1 Tim44 domain-containing protein [Snodgrassella sp.]MCO6518134.1 Tim44 domain-containing protein [Snodgrassella sp.]